MADGNLARGPILADTRHMTNHSLLAESIADTSAVQSLADVLASSSIRRYAGQSPIDWYTDLADWYLAAEDDTERARR